MSSPLPVTWSSWSSNKASPILMLPRESHPTPGTAFCPVPLGWLHSQAILSQVLWSSFALSFHFVNTSFYIPPALLWITTRMQQRLGLGLGQSSSGLVDCFIKMQTLIIKTARHFCETSYNHFIHHLISGNEAKRTKCVPRCSSSLRSFSQLPTSHHPKPRSSDSKSSALSGTPGSFPPIMRIFTCQIWGSFFQPNRPPKLMKENSNQRCEFQIKVSNVSSKCHS